MSQKIERIVHPELFFGFVAPIGVDLSPSISAFKAFFEANGYNVIEIKVTGIFDTLSKWLKPRKPLLQKPLKARYDTHIAYGNQLRETYGDDILATTVVNRIVQARVTTPEDRRFARNVYLIHQFKRKEEIDLLRSVYGSLFFQVSIYSRRGARADFLSRQFASSNNSANSTAYRADAEQIITQDENEIGVEHGQSVGKIFHDADVIISVDALTKTVPEQVDRFCSLIFSANFFSPTRMEYGMFLAKAAALRSLDLSRQVGAAIFSEFGEIVSLGANEVPKALGGTYWADEVFDDREYQRGFDSNDKRKCEILSEIVLAMNPHADVTSELGRKELSNSRLMDALEYGRIVHAEMSAISDAARTGRSTKNSTLYCTTFPCHLCAKHIIASGIENVIFLEPYPKSLAHELHSDEIEIEGADRGNYRSYPAVKFEHFFGVTPRRYRELFERARRKDKNGNFVRFGLGGSECIVDVKYPSYTLLENECLLQSAALSTETLEKLNRQRPNRSKKRGVAGRKAP